MKRILLTICIIICYGTVDAQYIYDDAGRTVLTVMAAYGGGEKYYSEGRQIGYVQNDKVYNRSGYQIGYMQGGIGVITFYGSTANVICTIQNNAFYSGGRRLGFVQQGIVYDASGKWVASTRGLSTLQIAIFYFYLANQ